MPSSMTFIGKYKIWLKSCGYSDVACIRLYTASDNSICKLNFYPPEVTPPPNGIHSWLHIPSLSYPLSALAPMIDILRNEEPLVFVWHGPPDNKGYITTYEGEEVGEEDDS